MNKNPLKIELYPENKPRYKFNVESLKDIIDYIYKGALAHSFDENKNLGFTFSNVPVLLGFYIAHINHLPLILRPDDIWLLIVQSFSNHVNENSEELRKLFVNFDGKKTLEVKYPLFSINDINKKILENFIEQINGQMKNFYGNILVETLTPNFTTTTKDSELVCKITIMGAFKKFFEYELAIVGCGIPYIILEGTADDYKKIILKCEELKKYKFDWYINRIVPCIQKMLEAKNGKIDIDFFKSIVQKKEVTENRYAPSGEDPEDMKINYISGWILKFFGYLCERDYNGKLKIFNEEKIETENFRKLAYQMVKVPFNIKDEVNNKEYKMQYNAGFIGIDKNEKNEVFPEVGWLVTPFQENEYDFERNDLYLRDEDSEEDSGEDIKPRSDDD